MKPVYERFIENPDFTKSEFVELIKCAEDPEAVRRLKEEAVRIREIYYGMRSWHAVRMGMSLDSGRLCYRVEKMLIIRMTGW